jgi:hypothetical protein
MTPAEQRQQHELNFTAFADYYSLNVLNDALGQNLNGWNVRHLVLPASVQRSSRVVTGLHTSALSSMVRNTCARWMRVIHTMQVYESRLGRLWPPAAKATEQPTEEFDR